MKKKQMTNRLAFLLGTLLFFSSGTASADSISDLASRIFERVAGVPLRLDDPRREQMESLIQSGDLVGAAAIATEDPNFINITVKQFATPSFNADLSISEGLNDATTLVMGIARDDIDYRELLWGDIAFEGDPGNVANLPALSPSSNDHYLFLDNNLVDLANPANLRKVAQTSVSGMSQAAGALTSRAWGLAFLNAGTNREGIEKTLQEFMCRPIETFKNTTVPNLFIRRDVSRAPGGDPTVFKNSCQGCHAGMDAMGGAFAFLDFWPQNEMGRLRNGKDANLDDTCSGDNVDCGNPINLTEGRNITIFGREADRRGVAYKLNRAAENPGRETLNDYWTNLWLDDKAAGWRANYQGLPSSFEGMGITEFGKMIANSRSFSVCTARKVFRSLCYRQETAVEEAYLQALADRFEENGYSLKKLYQHAASDLGQCIRR